MKIMQPPLVRRFGRATAFTIIELLVVISIIALLVAIIVPSLKGARDQAKQVKTRAMLHTLATGLENFKNENGKEFRSTNGYPPSARGKDVHEKFLTYSPVETMYGAQWLVRHLMGKDFNGFVQRRAVPQELRDDPADRREWYEQNAYKNAPLDRVGPYVSPDSVNVVPTKDLAGGFGAGTSFIMDSILNAPVVTDVFGATILYYASNPYGKVIATRTQDADAKGRKGIYVYEDNIAFAGSDGVGATSSSSDGWVYRGKTVHEIRNFGRVDPILIDDADEIPSFVYYICDRKVLAQTDPSGQDPQRRTVRPVNSDTYLLISAGLDGIYGTDDDVTNFDR